MAARRVRIKETEDEQSLKHTPRQSPTEGGAFLFPSPSSADLQGDAGGCCLEYEPVDVFGSAGRQREGGAPGRCVLMRRATVNGKRETDIICSFAAAGGRRHFHWNRSFCLHYQHLVCPRAAFPELY